MGGYPVHGEPKLIFDHVTKSWLFLVGGLLHEMIMTFLLLYTHLHILMLMFF